MAFFLKLKAVLLCVEGLFRSFVGEVKRNDEDLFKAVDASFERMDNDINVALRQYRDNSVFHVGHADGKGRGKA